MLYASTWPIICYNEYTDELLCVFESPYIITIVVLSRRPTAVHTPNRIHARTQKHMCRPVGGNGYEMQPYAHARYSDFGAYNIDNNILLFDYATAVVRIWKYTCTLTYFQTKRAYVKWWNFSNLNFTPKTYWTQRLWSGFMLNFQGIFQKLIDFIQDQNGKRNQYWIIFQKNIYL